MRRALKMLTDREVTPQLGLLKSTLLQLDSTFSERTYGVSSFRDFAEKLATAGFVTLRESGRNILVELREDGHHSPRQQESRPPQTASPAPRPRRRTDEASDRRARRRRSRSGSRRAWSRRSPKCAGCSSPRRTRRGGRCTSAR